MKYTGKNTAQISFPLGGIGTGCIGLGGSGALRDIEIKNRPNKNSTAEFTHFAVKAEDENGVVDARILQGDLETGLAGSMERPRSTGFGFGPDRGSMAGFPHFEKTEFTGEFPFARVRFSHPAFPASVTLEAFNPLIPTNEDDSSIPAAFFEISLKNRANRKLTFTVALSCNNFFCKTKTRHIFEENTGEIPEADFGRDADKKRPVKLIFLSNDLPKDVPGGGDLAIATDEAQVSFQRYWYRGGWFDNSTVFWQEFARPGRLVDRGYETAREDRVSNDASDDVSDIATLAAHRELAPGEKAKIRFVLSWSAPYISNYWQILQSGLSDEEIARRRSRTWKNYYAVLFRDSRESALYAMREFDRLYRETRLCHDAMFRSTLPECVLDAVTSNISTLKSPTCLRLEDGSFYGFEGVRAHEGSCEGTCTHVWSYAYALAFLFPRLERSARTNEYTYSMQPDGGLGFRLQLPLGEAPTSHRPAADGQFGTILRVYREFMISGDKAWLASIWPQVRRSLEYAWSDSNADRWDPEKTGLLSGCQHHTLDMELFGENAWLSGMYLAALKAASRLAEILGEKESAQLYEEIFARGKASLNKELFNGEYFFQKVDLHDRSILERYGDGGSIYVSDPVAGYWNSESGEIKYQIGEGCGIDQVLGQWHADLLGLGEIFSCDKTKTALKSIFRYNHVESMREHINPCRIFAANGEAGTVICAYPEGKKKPLIPVPYGEETMDGFEYQAASHMIRHGLESEGLACVKAVRGRYDGYKRNPYSEIECGSNYARSMSSYALLLFYSGFVYDMHEKRIGFHPIHAEEDYRFFWSLDTGFGTVEKRNRTFTLKVLYGTLKIRVLEIDTQGIDEIYLGQRKLSKKEITGNSPEEIVFEHPVSIGANQERTNQGTVL